METLFQLLEIYKSNSPDESEMKLKTKIDEKEDRGRIQNFQDVEPASISIRVWEGENIKVEKSWSDKNLAVQVEVDNLRISGHWSKVSDNYRLYVSKKDKHNREGRWTPKQRKYLLDNGFELHGPAWATKSNLWNLKPFPNLFSQ